MICKLLIIGWLSLGSALPTVALNRAKGITQYNLPPKLNETCMVGVPYGFADYIGQQVHFRSYEDNTMHGPWIVVDVENEVHYPYMRDNHLASDVWCKGDIDFVHHHGEIVFCQQVNLNFLRRVK